MSEIWLEAEGFDDLGGWIIEQQSMETLHSAYIMAHGVGEPVNDAKTSFSVQTTGKYNVWVLTRDWTAVWGVKNSAGKFQLSIDGKTLDTVLGTNGEDWAFQKAGEIVLEKGEHFLNLHDLTGFNGRCDAVYLTTSDSVPSSKIQRIDELRQRLNWQSVEQSTEDFELIVVGGGIAGICTALSAKRKSVKTLLIHDREILGGCNSSEIRVVMGGGVNLAPYEKLGNIVKEIAPIVGKLDAFKEECFEDNRKLLAFENDFDASAAHRILLHNCVTDVIKNRNQIVGVICTDTKTGKKTQYNGKWFADCSGDAVLSRLCGAEVMYGRESKQEYGEGLGGSEHQNLVMGHSIRWYSEEMDKESSFPDIDWNLGIDEDTCLYVTSGDWEQETGFRKHMINEIEYIRDYGLRAIYSNWSYQKNHSLKKEEYKYYKIKWVSPLGGKRESYRVKGDVVLTQNDIESFKQFEDATACMTWSIDLHFPEPDNEKAFNGEAFRSFAYHRDIVKPYPVPYRCLYSKDMDNLFLGGRLVSMTHVAFSVVRVMRTLGQLGEVVGIACALCKRHDCNPRQIYSLHLEEFKKNLAEGVVPQTNLYSNIGSGEAYHYKDIGWLNFHKPNGEIPPQDKEKFKRGIKYLGFDHKYPFPEELK